MLARIKHRIGNWLRYRLQHPDMQHSLDRLAALGVAPKAVVDIGAYRGDFAAMALQTWPNCRVYCFEPQPGKAESIEARFRTNPNVRVVPGLLAQRSGAKLNLSLVETASSVLKEHEVKHAESVELTSTSLDDWWSEHADGDQPDLMKLDVQGYELEVLKGAEASLAQVSVIIAEVNLLDIHDGVPLMHELAQWLAERGFVAFDVAGLTRRPLDRALWQMDLIFVRRDGPLRSDKRWVA